LIATGALPTAVLVHINAADLPRVRKNGNILQFRAAAIILAWRTTILLAIGELLAGKQFKIGQGGKFIKIILA